jgi:hypothetical protein
MLQTTYFIFLADLRFFGKLPYRLIVVSGVQLEGATTGPLLQENGSLEVFLNHDQRDPNP